MSKQPNIEEILESVDGIQPAHPKPFFTGRVLDRIQQSEAQRLSYSTPRFRLAVLAVAVTVALNILLYIYQYHLKPQSVIAAWKNSTPEWVVDYTENPSSSLNQVSDK